MKVTLRNGAILCPVECETYSITPRFCNIWVTDFEEVKRILHHYVCEGVRVLVLNNNYDSYQIGFHAGDIKIEV